jgi:hypothetical protein
MKYVVLINLGRWARGWQTLPEAKQAEVQAAWGVTASWYRWRS